MNIEMFLTAKEVEESLERQETMTCLAWCHDNKSRLRKMKVRLLWGRFIGLFRFELSPKWRWDMCAANGNMAGACYEPKWLPFCVKITLFLSLTFQILLQIMI